MTRRCDDYCWRVASEGTRLVVGALLALAGALALGHGVFRLTRAKHASGEPVGRLEHLLTAPFSPRASLTPRRVEYTASWVQIVGGSVMVIMGLAIAAA